MATILISAWNTKRNNNDINMATVVISASNTTRNNNNINMKNMQEIYPYFNQSDTFTISTGNLSMTPLKWLPF